MLEILDIWQVYEDQYQRDFVLIEKLQVIILLMILLPLLQTTIVILWEIIRKILHLKDQLFQPFVQ